MPSLITSAHTKSALESWRHVCLSLLLGPKNGKWEIHLHPDEKYSYSLTETFRLGAEHFFMS